MQLEGVFPPRSCFTARTSDCFSAECIFSLRELVVPCVTFRKRKCVQCLQCAQTMETAAVSERHNASASYLRGCDAGRTPASPLSSVRSERKRDAPRSIECRHESVASPSFVFCLLRSLETQTNERYLCHFHIF